KLQYQVEVCDGVRQGQQASVMQIRGRVLDAAQRKGLDGADTGRMTAVDVFGSEEPSFLEVMHEIVRIERRHVTTRALALAVEQRLTPQLLGGGKIGIEVAIL